MKKYNTMDFSQQLPTMDYDRTYQYITNPSKKCMTSIASSERLILRFQ